MRGLVRTAVRRWIYPRHPHVLRVRDVTGAYRELSVGLVRDGDQLRMALALDDQPEVLLLPLQVGWLRRVLRDEVIGDAAEVAADRDLVAP